MIDQIQITNFRGITKLELGGMKRVNLIVGANNAGKTSLLEAVALPGMLNEIEKLPGLFRVNPTIAGGGFPSWLLSKGKQHGSVECVFGKINNSVIFGFNLHDDGEGADRVGNLGSLQIGTYPPSIEELAGFSLQVIPVHHRVPDAMIPSFADAVRSPQSEKLLESTLAKIDNRVRSIRLDFADNQHFISVDLGLSERVPLSQAGQGIYRLVSIFSELLGSNPNICLIDEIENGIHWTALPVVWQGIAEIAEALNIQVFATTHSRECLTAAYDVFRKKSQGEAMDFSVIQLMRVKDEIQGRVLNGAHVKAAIENDIELR
jgi:hypothetical protein